MDKLKTLIALFVLWVVAGMPDIAVAGNTAISGQHVLNAATAAANHTSTALDFSIFHNASVQCNWSGLTGTIDNTVEFDYSNDGTTYTIKGTALAISGASGSGEISLGGDAVTESWYEVKYLAVDVTAGTIDCYVTAK